MAENSYYEKLSVAGNELVDTIRRLIADGSVRRIVVRDEKGKELLSIPMNLGAAVGAVTVLYAPVLAALGAVGALIAQVTVEVERTDIVEGEAVNVSAENTGADATGSTPDSRTPVTPEPPEPGTTSYSSGVPGEANASTD